VFRTDSWRESKVVFEFVLANEPEQFQRPTTKRVPASLGNSSTIAIASLQCQTFPGPPRWPLTHGSQSLRCYSIVTSADGQGALSPAIVSS